MLHLTLTKIEYTLNEQLLNLQNWPFYAKIESVLLFMDKT